MNVGCNEADISIFIYHDINKKLNDFIGHENLDIFALTEFFAHSHVNLNPIANIKTILHPIGQLVPASHKMVVIERGQEGVTLMTNQ